MHITNSWLKDAGYTIEQEASIYDDQLDDLIKNTKKYLDSFETMVTYKVRWKEYRNTSPVLPYRYINKRLIKNKQPH